MLSLNVTRSTLSDGAGTMLAGEMPANEGVALEMSGTPL
jgi:hypothetical protein